LGLSNTLRFVGSSVRGIDSGAGSIKRASNINHAYGGYKDAQEGSKRGPEGPPGHIPLRLEVLFAAPLIALGLLVSWWGINAGDWRDTGVSNVFKGAVAVLIGAAISAFGVSLFML
jgi:hypothetical protein